MAQILFRRLFEVRIQHGYYLDHWFPDASKERGSFYSFEIPAVQQSFVLENKYNLGADLKIQPSAETARMLKDARMQWRQLPTGLVVGIEVRAQGQGNNLSFFPVQPLPDPASWIFLLKLTNTNYYNITNHTFFPTLPGKYYFSNLQSAAGGKVFPSLATALPLVSQQRTWEMGEHVSDGNNILVAPQTTSDPTKLSPSIPHPKLADWPFFAHAGDRVALPKYFHYRFDPVFRENNPVSKAIFQLKDLAGNELIKIEKVYPAAATTPVDCALDFRYLPGSGTSAPLADGWYQLDVSINGSLFETRRILLRADLSTDQSTFGLIEISSGPTGDDFRLFHPDGSLRVAPSAGSSPVLWRGPVFQVRLMPRLTYWRYHLSKPINAPAPTPDDQFRYDKDHQTIISTRPRPLTKIHVPVAYPPANRLPSPDKPDLTYEENRYFSELFL